jgi:membrane protease YdiL (CAAX protease family)
VRFRTTAAVALGFLALLLSIFAGGVWTVLLVANLKINPTVPWSVTAMTALLYLLWRYLDGFGAPRKTAAARRELLRANPVPRSTFTWAMVAGLLSVAALAGLWIVFSQLVRTASRSLPDFSRYPLFTVIAVVAMASIVSSVAEEAAVRGYFQGYLERRLSGVGAILISSLVLAPAHGLTQGFFWTTMLFYFLVDSMLGAIACLTKSIVPGLLVHVIGLLIFFTLIWPRDAMRARMSSSSAGTWFWLHLAQTLICAGLAVAAFAKLNRLPDKRPVNL